MSASEKLQALELRDREGQFALMQVRDAIVAVVEAAEDYTSEPPTGDNRLALYRALSALDEALPGGEE